MQSSCAHRISQRPAASVGIRTGVAGRMGGGSVLAVRSFHQPHHLIGIDQGGGANPDEGKRAGDIPIGHLVSCLVIRLGLLGWASPAPRNERDQACQNEEQRAGQREYEVSWQRSGGYRQDSESDQESDGESDLRAERPRVAPTREIFGRVGDCQGAPPQVSGPCHCRVARGRRSSFRPLFAILNCVIIHLATFDWYLLV